MMRYRFGACFLIFSFTFNPFLLAQTYSIDKDHSSVSFKIRHLFTKVQGSFNEFEGRLVYDPGDPSKWKASAVIQADSIDTANAARDDHLRREDFFDVNKYPTIRFESAEIKNAAGSTAEVRGVLTMRGVQKPVVLDLQIHGVGQDPWGKTRAGFTATTTLNRKDYGLTWNKVLESGQLLVGEEVEVTIEAEAVRQD